MTHWGVARRLLGVAPEASGDPYALLGLPARRVSVEQVDRALRRRLEALSRRTDATRHEREEARRALHAAASQLADPRVQETILGRRREIDALNRTSDDPARPDEANRVALFRPLARRVLAMRGRFTHETRAMLFALASARGLSTRELLESLRTLGRGAPPSASRAPTRVATASANAPPGVNGAAAFGSPSAPPVYAGIEAAGGAGRARARRGLRTIGLAAVALVLGGLAIGLLFWAALSEADRPGGQGAPGEAPAQEALLPAAPRPTHTPAAGAEEASFDANETLALLRRASELLESEPGDAAWRFEQAHDALAENWTSLSVATRRAALGAIARHIVATTPGAESWNRSLRSVASGSEALADPPLGSGEVVPGVWSVGVMTRLLATPGLPARTVARLESALADALPGGRPAGHPDFASGAGAAVSAMISALPVERRGNVDPLDAWGAWIRVVDAVSALSPADAPPADRETLLLAGAERLLIDAPSPSVDSVTRAILRQTLGALAWDESSPASETARRRLLRWLEDPAIASSDLAVVTDWLVRESPGGLSRDLILSPTASIAQRLALRESLGRVWGLSETTVAEQELRRWREQVEARLRERVNEQNAVTALGRAAILSRYCEAAAVVWSGGGAHARSILDDPDEPIRELIEDRRRARGPTRRIAGDGEWALRYLSIEPGEPRERLAALAWLEQRDAPIGPIDADVLAEAALLRGRPPVRSAAIRNVRQRGEQIWMINGLLEAVERAPASAEGSDLIEGLTGVSLPGEREQAWRDAAAGALRRLLVERLASETEWGVVDGLGEIFRGSLSARLAALTPPGGPSPGAIASPLDAASALADRWLEEASRAVIVGDGLPTLETIERRREARRRLAPDPVQSFAAEQGAACEAMARVIAWERPARAGEVEATLRRLSIDRTRAPNVGAQISATAEAMTRLWMIRLDLEGPRTPDAEDSA